MSNAVEIVAAVNTLLTLLREANLSIGPIVAKIKQAQKENRDITIEDVMAASDAEDAARKRLEDALL